MQIKSSITNLMSQQLEWRFKATISSFNDLILANNYSINYAQ